MAHYKLLWLGLPVKLPFSMLLWIATFRTSKIKVSLSQFTQDLDLTYQALIHQSFHIRFSCPHENLAPPWGLQRSWTSQMVGTSVHCGFLGKLSCSWQAAHHIYLFVDPWCGQHRAAGAAGSDVQKHLLGQAHHSPGHWQCLNGTVTLMRQKPGTADQQSSVPLPGHR